MQIKGVIKQEDFRINFFVYCLAKREKDIPEFLLLSWAFLHHHYVPRMKLNEKKNNLEKQEKAITILIDLPLLPSQKLSQARLASIYPTSNHRLVVHVISIIFEIY